MDQQLQEDAADCLFQRGSSLHAPVTTEESSGQLLGPVKPADGSVESHQYDLADKSFGRKNYLGKHITVHQDVKNFACDFYNK